jgi:hypothetical protein
MPIHNLRRFRRPTVHLSIVFGLLLVVLGVQPAMAANVTVTGTVSSDNGVTSSGMIRFYADCDPDTPPTATTGWFNSAPYSVSIPTGTYKVQILTMDAGTEHSWHSAKTSCADADSVTISASGTLDLTVIALHTVTGTVTSSRGVVNSGRVEFYAGCSAWDTGVEEGSSGFDPTHPYSVKVPDGFYKVRIVPEGGSSAIPSWHSGKATCRNANDVVVSGGTTANLVALPGWNISGSVSSSNGPIDTATVSFFTDCSVVNDPPTGSATVEGGQYSVSLATGTYKVMIEPAENTGALSSWHSAKALCADADTVSVSADATVPLTAVAGANVTGHVSSANGAMPTGYVSFYADCGPWHEGQITNAQVAAAGAYLVTLKPGSYRVRIQPDDNTGALDSWHNAKQNCADAQAINVAGNQTLDLTAIAGANLTGTVTAANTTVTDAYLFFYDSCVEWDIDGPVGFADYTAGSPYLATLPNGTYRVRIEGAGSGVAPDSWHNAKTSCEAADVITVTGSATVNLRAVSSAAPPPPPPPPPPAGPPPGPQPPADPPAPAAQPTASTPGAPAAASLADQSLTLSMKAVKRKKSVALPASTSQGAPTAWASTTRKTCSVKKGKVKGVRKGKCTLQVSAPEVAGYKQFSGTFTVRVK